MKLEKDFREFLELLEKNNVKYLVVGAFSMGYHGRPRYTGDMDIWIRVDEENAQAVETVLIEFGFQSQDIQKSDLLVERNVIQLGYPPIRIDILTGLTGVDFDECYARRIMKSEGPLLLPIISLEDLRTNKRALGRNKDLDDLESLA